MLFLSSLAAKAERGEHNDFNTFRCPVKERLEWTPQSVPHEGERGHTGPCPGGCIRAVGVAASPCVWAGVGRQRPDRTRLHLRQPQPESPGAAVAHCDGVSQDCRRGSPQAPRVPAGGRGAALRARGLPGRHSHQWQSLLGAGDGAVKRRVWKRRPLPAERRLSPAAPPVTACDLPGDAQHGRVGQARTGPPRDKVCSAR